MDNNTFFDKQVIAMIISALMGGTGLVSFFSARAKERAIKNLTEAKAIGIMQSVYDRFAATTDKKLQEMEKKVDVQNEEISMLHQIVQGYKDHCSQCEFNKTK